MADNTIALRVQQLGAEGVRRRIDEVNNAIRAGAPVTKELKQEMSALGTEASKNQRAVRLMETAWRDNHITLTRASRVMSTVGSVARNMLYVTTALSVAFLAFGKSNSQLIEAEQELARAQRELVAAFESGDPERISKAQEDISVLTARIKELNDAADKEKITGYVNAVATGALTLGGGLQIIDKIGPAASKKLLDLRIALLGLQAAGWGAVVPLGIIAGLALLVAAGLYAVLTPGDQVAEFFKTFFPDASKQIDDFSLLVDEVFTMHIPNAFIFMANVALQTWNAVVGAVQTAVNGIISAINRVISSYNSLPGPLKVFGSISKIQPVDLSSFTASPIPYLGSTSAAALAGNRFGGGTQTPFAQVTRAGGGAPAGAPVINITINGDVSGEELANKVRDQMKDKLRELGYTGY